MHHIRAANMKKVKFDENWLSLTYIERSRPAQRLPLLPYNRPPALPAPPALRTPASTLQPALPMEMTQADSVIQPVEWHPTTPTRPAHPLPLTYGTNEAS